MGLFYTGKGDGGQSSVGKIKIDKTCIEIEALGDLDELNSLIGVVKSQSPEHLRGIFNAVQENLFIVQANVANFMFQDDNGKPKYKPKEFKREKITEIEKLIDDMEKIIEPEKGFIIPGTNVISAWVDLLRAVSRRAERSVLRHNKDHELPADILAYMNRLSSLFFAIARMESKSGGQKEKHPTYK